MKKIQSFIKIHSWTFLFSIISIEGLGILWTFVRVQSESKNIFILGLSLQRLISILATLILILFWASLAVLSVRRRDWVDKFAKGLQADRQQKKYVAVIISLFLTSIILALLPSNNQSVIGPAYYERLRPFLLWLALTFIEILIFLAFLWSKDGVPEFLMEVRRQKASLFAAALALTFFVVLWLVILITGLGIIPDDRFWNEAGVPVLGLQILFSLAVTLAFSAIFFARGNHKISLFSGWKLDLFVCLILWAVAAWLWSQTPMPRSYFAPGPYYPNQIYYPYSDAEVHDRGAQYVFIGQGLNDHQYFDKPFYMLLLTLFHLAVGNDYLPVVQLQAVCLAIFPALLYLVGKNFTNRTAGLLAGIFLIFQQTNAISATLQIQVSHSRLMMTEFPTAAGMALLALVIIHWLKRPNPIGLSVFIGGGILGVLILTRTNSLFLAPFIILIFLLTFGRQWRRWLLTSLLFLIGIFLVIGPWFFLNRTVDGQSFIEKKIQSVFGQRYDEIESNVPILDLTGRAMPTVTPAADDQSLATATPSFTTTPGQNSGSAAPTLPAASSGLSDESNSKSGGTILKALQFIPNHFVHNLVMASFILPTSAELESFSFLNLDLTAPYWKISWNGNLPPGNAIFLLVMLAILALGIGAAWNTSRLAGLVPLGFLAAYYLSNAFARTSGSRYLVPAGWVVLFYFAFGIIQVCRWYGIFLRMNFGSSQERPAASLPQSMPANRKWFLSFVIIAAGMLLVGSSLIWIGNFFPLRYPPTSSSELLQEELSRGTFQEAGLTEAVLTSFLKDPNAIIVRGKGLYPRYYDADKGEPTSHSSSFEPTGFSRLIIRLIGPVTTWVLLPLEGAPSTFNDNGTITVVGCVNGPNVIARAVVVEGVPDQVYLSSPPFPWSCP